MALMMRWINPREKSDGTAVVTFALEVIGGRSQQKFVPESDGFGTAGDARFDVVSFDPLRQPAQITVAIKRIRSHGPAYQHRKESLINKLAQHHQSPIGLVL